MVFESVFDMMGNFFQALMTFSESDIGLRLLFGLLVFTVLFGVSEFVLKNYAKNIRTTITLIIGILSAAMIPGSAVRTLSSVWGGFFYMLFAGIIPIGLIYWALSSFKGETKSDYFMKFILSFIAFIVASIWASGSFAGMLGRERTLPIWTGFDGILGIITIIAFVMWIVYLFKMIGAEQGETSEEIPENVKKWWKRMGWAQFEQEPAILRNIKAMIDAKQSKEAIISKIKRAEMITRRMDRTVRLSYGEVKKITDDTVRQSVVNLIQNDLTPAIELLDKKLREAESKVNAKDYDAAGTSIDEVIAQHRIAMSLEMDLMHKFEMY